MAASNPRFGLYFLKLSTARLFENVAFLERKLAERDSELATLRAQPVLEKAG